MFRLTTVAVLFAAIMHGVVSFLGNFSSEVLPFLIFTALYLYFAVFLYQQKRWAAWATLIVGVVGVVAVLYGAINNGGASISALYAAAVINAVVACCAAVALWTDRVVRPSSASSK